MPLRPTHLLWDAGEYLKRLLEGGFGYCCQRGGWTELAKTWGYVSIMVLKPYTRVIFLENVRFSGRNDTMGKHGEDIGLEPQVPRQNRCGAPGQQHAGCEFYREANNWCVCRFRVICRSWEHGEAAPKHGMGFQLTKTPRPWF